MGEVKAWPQLPDLLMEQLSQNTDVATLTSVSQRKLGIGGGLRFRAYLYSQDYANYLLLWLQACAWRYNIG